MPKLVLMRSGQSQWDLEDRWTGLRDHPLTTRGRQEGHRAANTVSDISLRVGHSSMLIRAQETLRELVAASGKGLGATSTDALNPRDYGRYTGRVRWRVKTEVGEDEFNAICSGWDHPIPEGETLKEVYEVAIPYYQETILADLLAGYDTLVVAHRDSLRALAKYLEEISDDKIHSLDIRPGEIWVYEINDAGKAADKDVRRAVIPA